MALLHMFRRLVLRKNVLRTIPSVRRTATLEDTSDESKRSIKMAEKPKLKKGPFIKNTFLGVYDVDMLTFPEVLDPEQLTELNDKLEHLDSFFKNATPNGKINDEIKSSLFGMQVPSEYGGLGLNATEYAKYCEVISQDGPTAIILAAHQGFGLKSLLIAGTKSQKEQYLPRLATGEWVAAFCFAEPQRSVYANIESEAKLALTEDKWILNGRKMVITENGKANLMTVIAKTSTEIHDGTKLEGLTSFLVERTYDGITFEKTMDITDKGDVKLCEVRFKNTPVPLENVIGNIGEGYKISAEVLGCNRFSTGSFAASVLKQFLAKISEYCVNQTQLGKQLMEFQLIQKKLALIAYSIYTIESLTYLTAGIIDNVENPDVTVESAIVKVYSSEVMSNCILDCQNIFGTIDFLQDSVSDTVSKNSKVFMLLEGSNDVLRMYIALSGLQHAGVMLQDMVHKTRNPLMNPVFILKKLMENSNNAKKNPKFVLGLDNFLHPSLQNSAKQLEYCVLKLQHVVEVLLTRHGQHITEKEIELNRLTDIVIGVYAMTAVLARSSRSYCIGLQDSENEIYTAGAICQNFYESIKQNVELLEAGPITTLEATYTKIAEKVINNRGYFYEHPLKRNFM